MPRGRKPKPTALKILEGVRADRINWSDPGLPPGSPVPPDLLEGEALQEWKRITAILEPTGVLTAIDGDALCLYCVIYARWKAAVEGMGEDFTIVDVMGRETLNPLLRVAQDSEKQMAKLLAEFGLTPSSRSRVKVTPKKKDELEEFLASKRKA